MLKVLLLVVSLLFLFSDSGEAIKCYQCRSDVDKHCGSKTINPNYSLECPESNGKNAVLCRKIHQKLRFKNEDYFTSIRECGYNQGHKKCYFFKFINLAIQETCECMQDNCNRGSGGEPHHMMILLLLVFIVSSIVMNIVILERVSV